MCKTEKALEHTVPLSEPHVYKQPSLVGFILLLMSGALFNFSVPETVFISSSQKR